MTLDESPASVESPPRTQLHKLVVEPLQAIPSNFSKPIASILGALDECGAAESRETLLEALVNILVPLPRFVRIVITSRFDILVQELDITSPTNARDTLDYIQQRVTRIRKKEGLL